jgi:MFS transporter, DHA1 family, tetracycline resistance protein
VLRRALTGRRLAPLVWLTFIANFAFIGMETTFALFGSARFDYGMVEMGLLFAYIGVIAAATQGVLVRIIVPRAGEVRVLTGGLVATGAGLLLLAPAQQLWFLLGALAVLAVGSGLVFATTTALISLAAGAGEQGTILGLTASVGAAARIAGPLVGAALFQHVDVAAPMVVGGALFVGCALAAVWVSARPAPAPSA